MIYIVNESIYNGTVTMDIMTSGIEAESYEKAVEKLKARFDDRVKIYHEDNEYISFSVKQKDTVFTVEGTMRNKPLEIS